jgi:hypothetical protein
MKTLTAALTSPLYERRHCSLSHMADLLVGRVMSEGADIK